MQISSRFTIALHIFACVDVFGEKQKITSDFLSSSINVNPVVIRRILSQLKKAGLIQVCRGTGGIEITKEQSGITFYDVYKAVDSVDKGELFHFHEAPDPNCPVGRNIHAVLDDKLSAIQQAMEDRLKQYTLQDLREDMLEQIKGEKTK